MSSVKIYGAPASNYVRAVRIACLEKGVDYEVIAEGHNRPDLLKQPEHLALHPFGKIPAFSHDGKALMETGAILRYIDEAFDGPALQPSDTYERARMESWVIASVDYLYNSFMRGIVIPYAFAQGEPDRAAIKAGAELAATHAKILDDALEGRDYIAGDSISLADIIIMPMLIAAYQFPEGQEVMKDCHNIGALYQRLAARPSFAETALKPAAEAAE